jgi:hypothetical protein
MMVRQYEAVRGHERACAPANVADPVDEADSIRAVDRLCGDSESLQLQVKAPDFADRPHAFLGSQGSARRDGEDEQKHETHGAILLVKDAV